RMTRPNSGVAASSIRFLKPPRMRAIEHPVQGVFGYITGIGSALRLYRRNIEWAGHEVVLVFQQAEDRHTIGESILQGV
ncbi:hypothetical protein, partial [Pseudomonas monteilii]|uniref:hypothetical protein n=1 Tax=Pseudomonas monteilii TaxID=76759 RepID=UPI0005345D57